MKRVLFADFFELRKSSLTWMLPGIAVLLGFFLPFMYYGFVVLIQQISEMGGIDDESLASMKMLLNTFHAQTVFYSCLPLSQGFGLVLTAMLGIRAVRPFGTGIYRNMVIAQVPRSAIYLSQFCMCLLLTAVSATLFTLVTAFATRITFGPLELSARAIWVIILLSCGIYLFYTAFSVFIAFLTRSVPATILVLILTPVLAQTVFSLAAPSLSNVSDVWKYLLTILPSVQSMYLSNAETPAALLWIAAASDVVLSALLTLFGTLRFRRIDLQ